MGIGKNIQHRLESKDGQNLLHDNSRTHTHEDKFQTLQHLKYTILQHPPYIDNVFPIYRLLLSIFIYETI